MQTCAEQEIQCAICMETWQSAVSTVPCLHTFCERCIVTMLQNFSHNSNFQCPICRVEVEMICQNHTAQNTCNSISAQDSTPACFTFVPPTGLRLKRDYKDMLVPAKRKMAHMIQSNSYTNNTLAFYGPEHAGEMAQALTKNNHITKIMCCELGSLGCRFFIAALYTNKYIVKMSFQHCFLTDHNVLDISIMLIQVQSLRHLKLDDNYITDCGLDHLSNALSCNFTLVKLSLNSNYISGDRICQIKNGLLRSKSLKSLSVMNNLISLTNSIEMAKALSENKHLEVFKISWKMTPEENTRTFSAWKDVVHKESSMKKLIFANSSVHLWQNSVNGEPLFALKTLVKLHMIECRLHPQDAGQIADFLRDNNNLQWLDLSHNQLADQGLQLLAQSLYQNHVLLHFAIQDNEITGIGFYHLFKMLQKNGKLCSLDACMNDFGDPSQNGDNLMAARALKEMLIENKSLTHLFMDFVVITEEQGKILVEGMRQNQTIKRFTYGMQNV